MKRALSSFAFRIFLVALVLRLIPVLLSFDLGIGLDDMFQYDMLARSLVAGNGYRWYAQEDLPLIQRAIPLDFSTIAEYDPRGVPTSFRPPLYPAFLALIYFAAGSGARRFFIVRLVQAFVGAALAPLTWTLAKRLLSPLPSEEGARRRWERTARLAAWVVAVYPMLVIYPLALATENLFFLLMLCSVLALLKAAEPVTAETAKRAKRQSFAPFVVESFQRARWFLLSGFLLGLAALTRSVALAFGGLAVLWVWFVLRQRKMAFVTFAALVVTVLPWMVRNSLLYGRPAGIETALGYDLYVSYHPQTNGAFQYPQSLDLMPILDDMQREEIGLAKAREFILSDPTRLPGLWFRRLGYFFGLERRALTYFYSNDFFGYVPAPALLTIAALMLLPFVLVSASAAFGLALARRDRGTWLLALLFLGYVTPHIVIIAEDRFHLTLLPFLAVLAASFWTGGLPALRERARTPTGRLALALAVLAVLLLLLGWGLELWRDADKLRLLFGPHGNRTFFPY